MAQGKRQPAITIGRRCRAARGSPALLNGIHSDGFLGPGFGLGSRFCFEFFVWEAPGVLVFVFGRVFASGFGLEDTRGLPFDDL